MLTRHTGIMARRLLVNWRVPPRAAQQVLPPSVRPHLVHGFAIVGLCLVRLEKLRLVGLPAFLGLASENVAIRIGVEMDTPAGPEKAVLIVHRDTDSRLNALCAPRCGFGHQHHVAINVRHFGSRLQLQMASPRHSFDVAVEPAASLSKASVFRAMENAAEFFRGSEKGYSPSRTPGVYHGSRLHLHNWKLEPMRVLHARSTFLDEFFGGTACIDSAFIMRDIPHTWTAVSPIRFDRPQAHRQLHAA